MDSTLTFVNMKISALKQWPAWICLLATLGLRVAADTAAPQILEIKPEGTNVAVRVKVGAGTQRLTIEGRSKLKQGSWTPRANAWANGIAGEITVRFPASGQIDLLRASSDDLDSLPLPPSFYGGKTNFPPLITSTSPAQSTGLVPGAVNGPTSVDSSTTAVSAPLAVESDIWKVDSNTVYFFNQYRGLQVIDISQPASPVLKATLPISGAGEQMYVVSSTGPGNAWIALVTRSSCGYSDSQIVLVQVQDGVPSIKSRLDLGGSIVESRMVGTRLIAAATRLYNYGVLLSGTTSYNPGYPPTVVSAFDLADPANPVTQKPLELPIYANVVSASGGYFLLSGIGPTPDTGAGLGSGYFSVVQVLDVSDSSRPPQLVGSANLAGTIADKFKLNAQNGVLSAVSQVQGQWTTQKDPFGPWWSWQPPVCVVETFSLSSSTNFTRLGLLTLVTNETLFGTRFDGDRLYVVTFHQVDPLWIIDLAAPASPTVSGKLQVTGFSTFLQPLGNHLLSLGVVTNHVAASLFDVSDASNPALLSRTILGDGYSGTEANWDEKAFSIFPDQGLIVLPWWGQRGTNQWFQGLQLIDLGDSTVTARGIIARDSSPRRVALANPTNLVSISAQELFTAGFADRDQPNVLASLPLLYHVDWVLTWGGTLIELGSTGTDSFAQLAAGKTPEAPFSKLVLTNYPITGASINGNTLAIFQHQNDNYRWDSFLTTNEVVNRLPQRSRMEWVTNVVVSWVPQPPLSVCTNILRTIVIPPSPLGPGYTTNYWVKVCHDVDQPPVLETNNVAEFVSIPMPDLLVTNEVVNTTYNNWVEYGSSRVTRVDLSDSGLAEAGHWEGYLTNFSWTTAKALWVSSNTVVWMQQNNYWFYPIRLVDGPMLPGAGLGISPGAIISPIGYWPSSGRSLAAFDLGQATPQFLGQTDLPAPVDASITTPFVSGSRIYVGHQVSVPGGQLGTNWFGGESYIYGLWAPPGYWESHYFLDVADFGDPANPVLRTPIELPGALNGISHDGNLLYTLRNGWATYGSTSNSLTALSYDGLSASIVDTLPLTNTPPVSVNPAGAVYLAQGAYGTNSPATLETWALNINGKWQRFASTPSGLDISTLNVFNDLLIGSDGTDLSGFDLTNPLAPALLGTQSQGCLWINLSQAEGDVAGGLWVPMGDYGLFHADFTASPGN